MYDKLESLRMLVQGRKRNLERLLTERETRKRDVDASELDRRIEVERQGIQDLLEEINTLTHESGSPENYHIVAHESSLVGNQSSLKVLFLAANPLDTSRLRIDEEIRAIDLTLRQTDFRNSFDIRQHWAVRVFDLQSYLLRHRPDVVHFSGHGSQSSEIILEDGSGSSRPVSSRSLGRLFAALKDNIRCVVLNACYSEPQARAIAEHIDCVIGMSTAIGDAAAISFAAAFYQALGYGRSIKTAFDLGCIQIDLEGLSEEDIPVLLCKRLDPEKLVLIS